MVKHTNTRVMITIPKNLYNCLVKIADRQSTTISKVIISMVQKNSNKLFEEIRSNCAYGNQMDLFELGKTKWID